MGERILGTESHVKIVDEQGVLDAALELMDEEDELGRGGSSNGEVWFSWLNRAEPDTWETGFDALRDWKWPARIEEEDVWTELSHRGQKSGQENLLFERIAPYVEGYVEYHTEYDRHYRFDFDRNG